MPRYGHRSDTQTHVAEILMMASVGLTIFGVSRSSKRTSRGRKEQLLAWVISFPSTHDEAAIHRDGLTSHVACRITAKPQNSISNLLGAINTSHRRRISH